MIQQLTPNLPVEAIEPSAAFFEKIGFEVAVRVPEEGAMDFAILMNGDQQVMYQTKQSLIDDSPAFAKAADVAPVLLYVTVPDVKAVAAALEGYEVSMDWRETFYGAKEIGFTEPGGHMVTFAEFPDGVK
ncbi:MAG: VOC family protein [Kordiimonas sp.]